MNSMKRQKDMTLKDELLRLEGAQYAGEEWRNGEIAPEGMKRLSQSRISVQFWICLMVKVNSKAVKKKIKTVLGNRNSSSVHLSRV